MTDGFDTDKLSKCQRSTVLPAWRSFWVPAGRRPILNHSSIKTRTTWQVELSHQVSQHTDTNQHRVCCYTRSLPTPSPTALQRLTGRFQTRQHVGRAPFQPCFTSRSGLQKSLTPQVHAGALSTGTEDTLVIPSLQFDFTGIQEDHGSNQTDRQTERHSCCGLMIRTDAGCELKTNNSRNDFNPSRMFTCCGKSGPWRLPTLRECDRVLLPWCHELESGPEPLLSVDPQPDFVCATTHPARFSPPRRYFLLPQTHIFSSRTWRELSTSVRFSAVAAGVTFARVDNETLTPTHCCGRGTLTFSVRAYPTSLHVTVVSAWREFSDQKKRTD